MDANELATIAIDAMPLDVLAEADKGQVWGVLQMALRTLEAQHESLLAEADNEAAEARKLLAAQISAPSELAAKQRELDDVSRERDAWKTKYYDKDVELAAVRVELGKLQAENARLHRSMEERMTAHIPGDVDLWRVIDDTVTKETAAKIRDVYRDYVAGKQALPPGAVKVVPVVSVPPGTDEL